MIAPPPSVWAVGPPDPVAAPAGLSVHERLADRAVQVAFRPEVPDAVDYRFAAVRDLLRDGDRSASHADVAFERAVLAFELALRRRHAVCHGTDPALGQPGLRKLYQWAAKTDRVGWSLDTALRMYDVRNAMAHPTANIGYGGPGGALNGVFAVVNAVNDLYESPDDRRARRDLLATLDATCTALERTGAEVSSDGTCVEAWRVKALAAEDRLDHPEVVVAVWPTFEVPDDPWAPLDTGGPQVIRASRAWVEGGTLSLQGAAGEVHVRPLERTPAERHTTWRRTVPALGDLSEILAEMRSLRADFLRKAETMGQLEKRLRRMTVTSGDA